MTSLPAAPPLHPGSLGKRVLQGAAIALLLVVLFLLVFFQGANLPFGSWALLPLLTVPAAGAFGGLLYYLTDTLRQQGGWKKLAINSLVLAAYAAGLWLGLVLAFAATGLWD